MTTLVTWNIQWGRGVDGRVDLDRVVQVLRSRGDPEVILLQEVADGFPDLPGHDGGDQFAALAARLPGWTVIEGAATVLHRAGRCDRFGNLVATRLPVEAVWPHLLPWPAVPAVPSMQRIALQVQVRAPFGPLRVTSTHLEYHAPAQREAQVQRLRELHRQAVAQSRCHRPGEPGPFAVLPHAASAVLGGDFNDIPGSPTVQGLLRPFDDGTPAWLDAWRCLHPQAAHPLTVGRFDRAQWPQGPRCFDFLLVSADLRERVREVDVDARTQASDHQPLWLRLDDGPMA